jgi:UDP-N-acetylglucosamine 1-carboxyvinyltransferase
MPARLEIEGGVPLAGTVRVSAAKNATLPALAAALLTSQPVVIENPPALADVTTMTRLLERLGAAVSHDATTGATRLEVARAASSEAPYELVSTMRASVLVLGPLLARTGVARVALPGGCAIGVRPIDQHLKGFRKLGAEISIVNGYVEARASRLKGARITTDLVTVTGTENLMMAAAAAEGTTVLENAAREPEVADLARLLSAMGARIEGAGTARVVIEGVPELGGARHRVIPDRIEAGTLIVAGAITGGDLTVTDLAPEHLSAVLAKLDECGVTLEIGADRVRVRGAARPRAADVITSPFPGFPTDMQAQIMTLLGLAEGLSRVTETIFENRFMHVAELDRMGARIETDGATAVIRGVSEYQGAPVMASDLRASAALVLAGLAARGRTTVSRVYHLDRGYERLERKLAGAGARITRTSA